MTATPTSTSLAGWIAGADGAAVLPQRHAGEATAIATPLRLLDTLALAPHGTLAIVVDGAGRQSAVPLVHDRDGWRRARAGDGIAAALTALLLRGAAPPGQGFEVTRWAEAESLGAAPLERAVDVDQTNESVVVGEQVVVKWAVRPAAGPEPAPDRLAALTTAGFTGMPRPWGVLRWRATEVATPMLVATVVAYLPGARDGWEWAVEDVRAVARGGLPMAGAASPWSQIGDLVARMHLALPERGSATALDAVRWRDSALAELEEALGVVDGAEGARLHEHEVTLRAMIGHLGDAGGCAMQDIHGDLHVGQILRWQAAGNATAPPRPQHPSRDNLWTLAHQTRRATGVSESTTGGGASYAVTDFDGNPVLSPAERVAPAPAAVDLAGLLQSLDHVGRVVSHRSVDVPAALVDEWITAAQRAALDSYRDALAAAGRPWLLDESLLPALRARQVVREFLYAARHLPHWRYVPHAALPTLVAAAQTPGRPVRRPTGQA